jgi:cytochrome P450 enzyme
MTSVDLPLGDPGFNADPYPRWAELRAEGPVVWWDVAGAWLVLDHAHALDVLRDDEHFSPSREYWEHYTPPDLDTMGPYDRIFASGLFHVAHDDHVRLRRLVMKAFTPKGVQAQQPFIEAEVDRLLDGHRSGDSFDVVEEYANILPAQVIAHLLGIPENQTSRFKTIADNMIRGFDPVMLASCADEIDEAVVELVELVDRTLESLDPDADVLLARLRSVEEEGERLTHEELLSLVATLIVGGSDTTVHAIALGTLSLLENPRQRDLLLGDRERLSSAVTELLRYSYIGNGIMRYAREPATLAGHVIERGAMVIVNLGAAHHDALVFDAPATLDVRRDVAAAFVFGAGAHYCIGAALARLEIIGALHGLFSRFPQVELAGEPVWGDHLVLRGMQHLPVRL